MADKKNGVNPVVMGVAGAVVGAMAGAAAVVLSDEKNRKKVEKMAGDWKDKGEKLAKEIGVTDAVKKLTSGEPAKPAKKAKKR